jgi:hypothetical protein
MSVLLLAAVSAALVFLLYSRRSKSRSDLEAARDSTPALEAWLREALELELAEGALGMRGSTPEERRALAGTLGHEPDADIVGQIEEKVHAVELEFVRYAHESEVEATVRVRYEDGNTGTSTRRFALPDVPVAVRQDFEQKGSSRVFRSWAFPWQRVRAL